MDDLHIIRKGYLAGSVNLAAELPKNKDCAIVCKAVLRFRTFEGEDERIV